MLQKFTQYKKIAKKIFYNLKFCSTVLSVAYKTRVNCQIHARFRVLSFWNQVDKEIYIVDTNSNKYSLRWKKMWRWIQANRKSSLSLSEELRN